MNSSRIEQIQKEAGYAGNTVVASALLTVWNECAQSDKWKPIATAPKDGTFIMLLMDSGYSSTPYCVIIAQFVSGYVKHEGKDHRWRDHANDSVFDGYQRIIGWKEWEVPEIDFDPDEHTYRYLDYGEIIREGDQFERGTGVWATISAADVDNWRGLTGKRLRYEKGNKKVRRKL